MGAPSQLQPSLLLEASFFPPWAPPYDVSAHDVSAVSVLQQRSALTRGEQEQTLSRKVVLKYTCCGGRCAVERLAELLVSRKGGLGDGGGRRL